MTSTTTLLRDLIRLGGPLSGMDARRLALKATRDISDETLAGELHALLVERLEDMVRAHDLGEALSHDLLADGIDAERVTEILDRIDAALRS